MPYPSMVALMGHNPIPPAPKAMGYRPPPAPAVAAATAAATAAMNLSSQRRMPGIDLVDLPGPVKPAMPTYADGVSVFDVMAKLERKLRHRRSWLPWLRRRAYAACLELIRLRHQVIDALDGNWKLPEPGGLPPRTSFQSDTLRK